MKNKNRYRLIKEYPNSPPIGSIISYSEEGKQYLVDNSFPTRGVYNINPEEYPEFWENIKVKNIESKAKMFLNNCGNRSITDTYTAYIVEKMLIGFGKESLKE